jgi:hypothetical protein
MKTEQLQEVVPVFLLNEKAVSVKSVVHKGENRNKKHDQSHSGLKDVRGLPKKHGLGGPGNWEDIKGILFF